jgi:hypothetical protein
LRERLGQIEAVGARDTRVIQTNPAENFHPLIATADLAFRHHYPLLLTPDHFWLPVAQGIGQHINQQAESLRSRFVSHSGRERIVVRRDEFRLDDPDNDWAGCLEEFGSRLTSRANPELADLLSCDFSTTGPVESAASQAVLMGALSAYFEYEVRTLCGIPEIQLAGSVDDYDAILAKLNDAESLLPELGFWLPHLRRIIHEIGNALRGRIELDFWASIYKRSSRSGGDRITGWLTDLFPYTKRRINDLADIFPDESVNAAWGSICGAARRGETPSVSKPVLPLEANPRLGQSLQIASDGLAYDQIPDALTETPFIWKYLGNEVPCRFVAGLGALIQHPETFAVSPLAVWAVCLDAA